MKTIKSLLYVIVAVLFVGLSSCGSDGPGSMNRGDAQAAFESVGNNLASSIGEATTTPGALALNSFADLTSTSDPFASRFSASRPQEAREKAKSMLASLRTMIVQPAAADAKFPGGEGFIFEEHTGVYAYDFELGYFTREGNNEKIIIQYPKDENSTENDAEFQLAGYEEILVGEEYNPTFIDATLYIEGDLHASIDLTAEYVMTGENIGDPTFVDLSLTLTPFTFDLFLDDENQTTTKVSETLSKSGVGVLIGAGVTVTYLATPKIDENIGAVSGYFQLMNIKFIATITREDVMQNPENISITVKIDGRDAGKIVEAVNDDTGESEPHIKYKDGSIQPLQDVFGTLLAQLSVFFPEEEPM